MATGTLVDVVMPQMGVSVSEGTITRWAKAVGETIAADETIVEISTDKVDTEIPLRPRAWSRSCSPPRARPCRSTPGSRSSTRAMAAAATATPQPAEPAGARRATRRGTARRADGPAAPAGGAAGPARTAGATARQRRRDGRTFVSPVVARMVAEHGLDVSAIPGTGRGGRVTKKDVQQYIEHGARRRAGRGAGRGARRAPLRAARPEAPAAPAAPRRRAAPPPPRPRHRSSRRGGPRRGALPLQHDPQGDRAAHAPLARDGGAGDHGDRGRHDRHRQPAQEVEAGVPEALRRQPHLRPVRRPGDDRCHRPLAVGQRRGAGRDGPDQEVRQPRAWPSRSTMPRA